MRPRTVTETSFQRRAIFPTARSGQSKAFQSGLSFRIIKVEADWMKYFRFCLKLFSFFVLAIAPLNAATSPNYVVAFNGQREVAVLLQQEADFVVMALTLRSDQKNPEDRIVEIQKAQAFIESQAREVPSLVVQRGVVSLSARAAPSKFAISSSMGVNYGGAARSSSELLIMVKLESSRDVYAGALMIRQFLDSLDLPGKSDYSLGQMRLAVKDPEQFRKTLLSLIAADVKELRSVLGVNAEVSLNGLAGPVLVRQLDDRRVELFLDYTMQVDF